MSLHSHCVSVDDSDGGGNLFHQRSGFIAHRSDHLLSNPMFAALFLDPSSRIGRSGANSLN